MMRWLCLVALAVGACGGEDDGGGRALDASAADVGSRADAGGDGDSGRPADGGSGGDASVAEDAGAGLDSGPLLDAEVVPDGFEVLTINLQNSYLNGSTWPVRRDAIAAGIGAWQPDVVCVQEAVQTSSDPNDAQEIADLVGYELELLITHMAFVFEEGIATLSRWPIVASESVQLPIEDLGGIAERHVLMVDVDTPSGEHRVFCSHMSINTDSGDKADEAAAAFAFMDARRTEGSAFFAGDLNAEPDTLAMRVLRGEATHEGVTGDLVDGWLALHPSDPGYTIPSDAPDRRIDYVYVVPGTGAAGMTIRECERVFTEPVSGTTYASDHLGVRCVFDLPE